MNFRRRKGMGRGEKAGESGSRSPRDLTGGGALRRWALGAALVLVAVGVGYLMAAELLFPASSPAETENLTPVPDLGGSPLEEARSRLREAGLALRVSSRVPPGTDRDAEEDQVLAQRPIGGQLAAPGDTVEVTVAAPEGPLRMPALRGIREAEARRVLEGMGFEVVTAREAGSVAPGEVVRTVPPAAEAAATGSEVRLVLSEGPPVAGAPELVGRHIDDVRSILADSGLALGAVSYDTAAFAAPGRIVGQSPPAGFSLREGQRVGVRVAGHPPEPSAGPGAGPDTTGSTGGR